MTFLLNCWYVAAWSDELGAQPLGRRILDEPVVMYRLPSGAAVALQGRCPHRFAPLHLGKVVGADIQCPYHGLRFNAEGACTFNPQGNGATPKALHVKTYPLIEKYGTLWIWMGPPERADPALLPDYGFLEDPQLARIQGYIHSRAHYELLTDNLLDLGHVDFLHETTLGCEATARAKTTVRVSGNTVTCDRWMANDFQGPLPSVLLGRVGQRVDAWLDVKWDPPALVTLTFGMTDVGGARENGMQTLNVHFMTPETQTSTHYFWASSRAFRTDDHELSEQMLHGINLAFNQEDKPMIEAQQAMMGTTDLWSLKPVLLAGDAAPVQARRVLARLIESERAQQDPA
ncbi:MAG TPA: aromatic ring-hydroxylating dioxygenase subunit alpha [Povalibacter sp.]|uniref:aromatic ring-hydroxylating dioxygenase subunit alpha n=1 Tax=Povalibacter sp. TaxID=1962978 RepID=UPI002BC86007|nr:aromatic ring-hydroxylating dioxygenase subunit alpha [Povalibacter sp.]HMN43033.1 aromatic ring-hydroxylating dioxygenase subunit alpha [Povalibacter sp.]